MTDDIKTTLDKVNTWIQEQGKQQPERSTAWRWTVWLTVGALVTAIIAYLYYKLWRQAKELAKLRHEHDVAAQQVERIKVQNKLDQLDQGIEHKLEEFNAAKKKFDAAETKLKEVEQKHEQTIKTIDELHTWDDVDQYLGRK